VPTTIVTRNGIATAQTAFPWARQMHTAPRVVAWPGSTDRGESPVTISSGQRLRHDEDELWRALEGNEIDCLILDPASVASFVGDYRHRLLLGARRIVWRCTLSASIVRTLRKIARIAPSGTLSLREFDNLASDVDAMLRRPIVPSPEMRMILEQPNACLQTIEFAVSASAILGRRRRHLGDLACACAISGRTLQWRLSQSSAPSPSALLGWATALHTVWRMDTLDWSIKQCASDSGFSTADRLSEYVRGHVGQRPRALLAAGGFDSLLSRWRSLVSLGSRTRSDAL
jgi:hypothetical protein